MYSTPPYLLLVAGLLASLAAGVAFNTTLQQSIQAWSKSPSTRPLSKLKGPQILIPFVGICFGTCIFLAAGLSIFGFSLKVAFIVAAVLTLLIGLLIWSQFGKILIQLEQGGSRALDLDAF
ncbi:MAG: hypothetical protein HC886_19985 [Leptolyngbyaceae cyanobacterium SM1_1_3]|nr:hypothetical protein [Leptolyngbyaceae cyanobacterium SM1_1_3]NJN05000.1 hypothetical protein [Leptolyngbyaceae cyanobacterium RM1_1_2]NJO11519.1 hypothetical protein [Leptolyngbyaceae cyanobacterium SL_1_1]